MKADPVSTLVTEAHPIMDNVQIVTSLWTTRTVARLLDTNEQTLTNWRDRRGLPFLYGPGNHRGLILFDPAQAVAWARETGRAFDYRAATAAHAQAVYRAGERLP